MNVQAQSSNCTVIDTFICQDCLPNGEESAIEIVKILSPFDCEKYFSLLDDQEKEKLLSRYTGKSYNLNYCNGNVFSDRSLYIIEIDSLRFEQNSLGFGYKLNREFLRNATNFKIYSKCENRYVNYDSISLSFLYNDIQIDRKYYISNIERASNMDLELFQIATNVILEFSVNNSKVGYIEFYLGRPSISYPISKFK